jgi:hypothetical protein
MKRQRAPTTNAKIRGIRPNDLDSAHQKRIARFGEDLAFLRRRLGAFDFDQLVSGVAALELVTENSPFTARLELAETLVASLAPRRGATPDWGWLNAPAMGPGGLGAMDDPLEYLFCEEIAFTDGPYLVLPSRTNEDGSSFQALLAALFSEPSILPEALTQELFELAYAVLRLSHAMATKANLVRGLGDDTHARQHVVVPVRRRFDRLRSTVTFSEADLVALAGPTTLAVLAPLIRPAAVHQRPPDFINPTLVATPLERTDAGVIVASPRSLAVALRHRLLTRITERGLGAVGARAIHERHAAAAQLGARRFGWMPLAGTREAKAKGVLWSRQLYLVDAELIADVIVVTDPLHRYDPSQVTGPWPGAQLVTLAGELHGSYAARTKTRVLSLTLVQPIGRWIETPFAFADAEGGRHRSLTMTVDDFGVIAALEAGDPLALWKFATACAALKGHSLLVWDALGLYEFHRRLHHALQGLAPLDHQAGGRVPIVVKPGSGSTLRREISDKFDPHPAPYANPEVMVTVARVFGDQPRPIYLTEVPQDEPGRLMTALDRPLWIIGPSLPFGSTERLIHDALCDVIAYWIWQGAPALGELGASDACAGVVRVESLDLEEWQGDRAGTPVGPIVQTAGESDQLRVTLLPGAALRCYGADNSGEREIMSAVLAGLFPQLVAEQITGVIDRVLPLGPRRRIPALTTDPRFDTRNLPALRTTQDFDLFELRRRVGTRLLSTGRRSGPVHASERVPLLNAVVGHCYELLRERVRRLSSKGLLEAFVLFHERLICEDYLTHAGVESELRLWSTPNEVEARLRVSLPEFAHALVASRFLIEYIVARPPRGREALGLTAYDELLALASEIVHLGMTSDGIQYGVVEQQIMVDRSGALRFGADDATVLFADRLNTGLARERIAAALQQGDWSNPYAERQERAWQKLEHAFAEAEGFELTELIGAINALVEPSDPTASQASAVPEGTVVATIAKAVGCSTTRAQAIVNYFALGPRDDFLVPPAPASRLEVLPWRYNRTLSYYRRPFLRRSRDLVWGVRQLMASKMYLFELCRDGRLRRTPGTSLDRALNKLRSLDALAFNAYIASLFRPPRYAVAERVTQLNRTLLARSNKDPIGDIDVLVADRAQRTLYSIDTKDHALARNPYEMDIESRHIFERVGRHPSLADRHLERDAWLRQHRTDALAHLRLDSSGPPWRVVSLLVFDRVLAVTARRGLPLPLLDVTTLEERVRGGSVLVTPAELRGRPAASDHGRAGFDIARAE